MPYLICCDNFIVHYLHKKEGFVYKYLAILIVYFRSGVGRGAHEDGDFLEWSIAIWPGEGGEDDGGGASKPAKKRFLVGH